MQIWARTPHARAHLYGFHLQSSRAAEQPAEHMHMHEAAVAFPAPDNEKQLGEEKLRSGCKDRSKCKENAAEMTKHEIRLRQMQ